MTLRDLIGRFPEIPSDLHEEAALARFTEIFGAFLATAAKPSACASDWTPENRAYMKLVSPIGVYGLGLSSRERVLEQLDGMVEAYKASEAAFVEDMLAVSK